MTLSLIATTWAQSYKEVINAGTPAVYPGSPFTADANGNLYTVMSSGGTSQCFPYGCGAVYKWRPSAHKLPVMLYSFTGAADGGGPAGQLRIDDQGNLYGVAAFGGDLSACFGAGCGVVYRLSPTTGGAWTETILYTFEGGADGYPPISIVFDAQGNLFGITRYSSGDSCPGGVPCGTVFELSPTSSGPWTLTTLHTFSGGADGDDLAGSLAIDSQGNLFGTGGAGGVVTTLCPYGCGTVFEVSPVSGSGWNFSTLYSFDYTRGSTPLGSLVIDAAGNLYGTAHQGGRSNDTLCQFGCGVTFEISPSATGWKQTLLHSFAGPDGGNPEAGLLLDGSGNLFGTTFYGGNDRCNQGIAGCGVVFELSPSGGHWLFNHAYTFQGYDGQLPNGNLIMDSSGNIFGTTVTGGTGFGNMYELSPQTH
jgi:uncharacterized repeat protein (TIGR03803 family)